MSKSFNKMLDSIYNGYKGSRIRLPNQYISKLKLEKTMLNTHKLNEQGFNELETYKNKLSTVVNEILEILPEGRDKSIFITKIEEASFFGSRAISSKPGNFTEIINYPKDN